LSMPSSEFIIRQTLSVGAPHVVVKSAPIPTFVPALIELGCRYLFVKIRVWSVKYISTLSRNTALQFITLARDFPLFLGTDHQHSQVRQKIKLLRDAVA
jgi:hypothetical protein